MHVELVREQIIRGNNEIITSYNFKERPSIAIVTNIAWNLYNFRYGLAEAIKKAGYEPVLIAAPDSYVQKIEEAGWNFIPMRHLERTGINLLKDVLLFKEFITVYKHYNISFCLHYNAKPLVYAGLAASFLNIPYISTITGLAGPFSGNRYIISKIVSFLYKISLKKSHKVLFQNEEDRTFFLDKKIVEQNITAIVEGSGVNMDKFKQNLYATPIKKDIVFFMFSRLSKAKGVENYVEAARVIKKQYKNVRFLLAGPFDHDKLAIKKQQVERWESEKVIEYLGVSDHIQEEISKADIIVYPSYYREGVPKSLIESAAMSRPIITTDNVGCREVVKDGVNGFLVPVKDVSALVAACEKFILMSEAQRKAFGEASRKLVEERFAETSVTSLYVKLIKERLQANAS